MGSYNSFKPFLPPPACVTRLVKAPSRNGQEVAVQIRSQQVPGGVNYVFSAYLAENGQEPILQLISYLEDDALAEAIQRYDRKHPPAKETVK